MPREKAQTRRMVEEARKNLLDAVARNIVPLEKSFCQDEAGGREMECLRGECDVERRCRAVLREAALVFRETKGTFQSKRLAEVRRKIENALKEIERSEIPNLMK